MSLLLIERAQEGHPHFRISGGQTEALIPERAPSPGEQYRFHFDMTKCIGCRCCEVACAEQNANPIEINWRRVGEIEGGIYPFTQRYNLSMGCNHCLDAACLKGCPVNAFRKDAATGLVLHNTDACIGCQYCTWNCPYGVVQYNPDRGVVGKCDMCYGRLTDGRAPACVDACPEGAIQVELVDAEEWRRDHAAADAPGMPAAKHTVSTTRITLPENIAATLEKADYHRVRPEHPHWALVFMLVLTQLAVGAFVCLPFFQAVGRIAFVAPLAVVLLALSSSTLHLGRPIRAYRALRMWRRSWLSREVLLLSLFAGFACLCGFFPLRPIAIATALVGVAGVTASAFIYLVPARPSWNSPHTLADFHLTGLLLGPLFLSALGVGMPPLVIVAMAAAQLLNRTARFLAMASADEFELRATARLLARDLKLPWLGHLLLLIAGGMVLPLFHYYATAFAAALAGELLSRYLFFVSVVPRNMALQFARKEAA